MDKALGDDDDTTSDYQSVNLLLGSPLSLTWSPPQQQQPQLSLSSSPATTTTTSLPSPATRTLDQLSQSTNQMDLLLQAAVLQQNDEDDDADDDAADASSPGPVAYDHTVLSQMEYNAAATLATTLLASSQKQSAVLTTSSSAANAATTTRTTKATTRTAADAMHSATTPPPPHRSLLDYTTRLLSSRTTTTTTPPTRRHHLKPSHSSRGSHRSSGRSHYRAQAVQQWNATTGQLVAVHSSVRKAHAASQVRRRVIYESLQQRIAVEGYIWKYVDEDDNNDNNTANDNNRGGNETESSQASSTIIATAAVTNTKTAAARPAAPVGSSKANQQKKPVPTPTASSSTPSKLHTTTTTTTTTSSNIAATTTPPMTLSSATAARAPGTTTAKATTTTTTTPKATTTTTTTPSTTATASPNHPKCVQQLKDGRVVATFSSVRKAHDATRISRHAITECLRGIRTDTSGYAWRVIDRPVKKKTNKKTNQVSSSTTTTVLPKKKKPTRTSTTTTRQPLPDLQTQLLPAATVFLCTIHQPGPLGVTIVHKPAPLDLLHALNATNRLETRMTKKACQAEDVTPGSLTDQAGIRPNDWLLLAVPEDDDSDDDDSDNDTIARNKHKNNNNHKLLFQHQYQAIRNFARTGKRPLSLLVIRPVAPVVAAADAVAAADPVHVVPQDTTTTTATKAVGATKAASTAAVATTTATTTTTTTVAVVPPFCALCNGRPRKRPVHHTWCPQNPHFYESGAHEIFKKLQQGVQLGCPACQTEYQQGKKLYGSGGDNNNMSSSSSSQPQHSPACRRNQQRLWQETEAAAKNDSDDNDDDDNDESQQEQDSPPPLAPKKTSSSSAAAAAADSNQNKKRPLEQPSSTMSRHNNKKSKPADSQHRTSKKDSQYQHHASNKGRTIRLTEKMRTTEAHLSDIGGDDDESDLSPSYPEKDIRRRPLEGLLTTKTKKKDSTKQPDSTDESAMIRSSKKRSSSLSSAKATTTTTNSNKTTKTVAASSKTSKKTLHPKKKQRRREHESEDPAPAAAAAVTTSRKSSLVSTGSDDTTARATTTQHGRHATLVASSESEDDDDNDDTGGTASNHNDNHGKLEMSWEPCCNPWGPDSYTEQDVLLFSSGRVTDVDTITRTHGGSYARRFEIDPFSSTTARYSRTHSTPAQGFQALVLKRVGAHPWGFSVCCHEFGGACLVSSVVPTSPVASATFLAAASGPQQTDHAASLRPNDMIIAVNGKPVGGMTEASLGIELETSGSELVLLVSRHKQAAHESHLAHMAEQRFLSAVDQDVNNEHLLHWTDIGGSVPPVQQQQSRGDDDHVVVPAATTRVEDDDEPHASVVRGEEEEQHENVQGGRTRIVGNNARVAHDATTTTTTRTTLQHNDQVTQTGGEHESCTAIGRGRFGQVGGNTKPPVQRGHVSFGGSEQDDEQQQADNEKLPHKPSMPRGLDPVGGGDDDTADDDNSHETNTARGGIQQGDRVENSSGATSKAANVGNAKTPTVSRSTTNAMSVASNVPQVLVASADTLPRETDDSSSGGGDDAFVSQSRTRQPCVSAVAQPSPDGKSESTTDTKASQWSDDGHAWCGCVCGKTHREKTKKVFWIQCDDCGSWYCVAEACVGFREAQAADMESWVCWGCEKDDLSETGIHVTSNNKADDDPAIVCTPQARSKPCSDKVTATHKTKDPAVLTHLVPSKATTVSADRVERKDIVFPRSKPHLKTDGTYQKPRGVVPKQCSWDAHEGVWVRNGRGANSCSAIKASPTDPIKTDDNNILFQREDRPIQDVDDVVHAVGALVCIREHAWPGVNNPEGIAKVTKSYVDTNGYQLYDVKYIIGRSTKGVLSKFVQMHTFS